MTALDEMIKKLELNLGKKQSVSPFDDLRKKYGSAKSAPKQAEQKKEEKKPEEEKKQAAAPKEQKAKKEKQPKGGKAPAEPKVEFASPELEWFNACDLRVGKIVECETNESSEKLYFEKIDLGEG